MRVCGTSLNIFRVILKDGLIAETHYPLHGSKDEQMEFNFRSKCKPTPNGFEKSQSLIIRDWSSGVCLIVQ